MQGTRHGQLPERSGDPRFSRAGLAELRPPAPAKRGTRARTSPRISWISASGCRGRGCPPASRHGDERVRGLAAGYCFIADWVADPPLPLSVFEGPKEKQDHGEARDSGVRAWVRAEAVLTAGSRSTAGAVHRQRLDIDGPPGAAACRPLRQRARCPRIRAAAWAAPGRPSDRTGNHGCVAGAGEAAV
jgi:hypothetical protein